MKSSEAMRQSSSDRAAPVIALTVLCIIELLVKTGPAHQGAAVCLCPRHRETHRIMKNPLCQRALRNRTPSIHPSNGCWVECRYAFTWEGMEQFVASA